MDGLMPSRRKVLLGAASLAAMPMPGAALGQQHRQIRHSPAGPEPPLPPPPVLAAAPAARSGPAWDATGRTFLFDPDVVTARAIEMSGDVARVVQLVDVGGSGRTLRQIANLSARPPLVTVFGRGVLDLDQGFASLDADGAVNDDMRNIAPSTGATVHVVWITPARLGGDHCPLFGVYTADSYYPCNMIGINTAIHGHGLINWREGNHGAHTAGSIRRWKPNTAYLLTVRYNMDGSTDLFVDGVRQGTSDAPAPLDDTIPVTGGQLGGLWPRGEVCNSYGKIGAVMRYATPRTDAKIATDALIKKQRYWDVASMLGSGDEGLPSRMAAT